MSGRAGVQEAINTAAAPVGAPPLVEAEWFDLLRAQQLLARYGMLLDQDQLEQWVELFTEDAQYKVSTRENEQLGLPVAMIWCDNRAMIADRVQSLRHVNEYNLHWARRVIGPPDVISADAAMLRVQAAYSLYQTDLEGATRSFSVGRYDFTCRRTEAGLRLSCALVIADTALVPTLLAAPI